MNPGWLRRLLRTGTGRFGIIVIVIVAATAAVSLFWTPFDPALSDVANRWAPPGRYTKNGDTPTGKEYAYDIA